MAGGGFAAPATPLRMAENADDKSWAEPGARPEWTPAAAYERALQPPKSLAITSGAHFDAYTEPGLSETSILAAQ